MIGLWLVTITGFSDFARASRLIRPLFICFPDAMKQVKHLSVICSICSISSCWKNCLDKNWKDTDFAVLYICYMSYFISLIMEGFLCLNCASNSIYLCPRHTDSTLNICLRLFSYLFCLLRYPWLKNIWEH